MSKQSSTKSLINHSTRDGKKSRFAHSKNRDSSTKKISKKGLPLSSNPNPSKPKAVFTSTKQVMNYVTIKGIESDTSYVESEWPLFCSKELMDNSYDFENDYYSNISKQDRMIAVSVWADEDEAKKVGLIHIRVRNSNVDNVSVFGNLEATFDFNQWYSSKRDQHRLTCGSLGDALKRILGMGYASMTHIDVGDSFADKQWDHPLILRFNDKEYRVFIRVEEFRHDNPIRSEIQGPYEIPEDRIEQCKNCIEIEVTLPKPLPTSNENNWLWHSYRIELYQKLLRYYKAYKIAKSRIDFQFQANSDLDPHYYSSSPAEGDLEQ